MIVVTAALAVLLAVLPHLAWPPVVVAILGTMPGTPGQHLTHENAYFTGRAALRVALGAASADAILAAADQGVGRLDLRRDGGMDALAGHRLGSVLQRQLADDGGRLGFEGQLVAQRLTLVSPGLHPAIQAIDADRPDPLRDPVPDPSGPPAGAAFSETASTTARPDPWRCYSGGSVPRA